MTNSEWVTLPHLVCQVVSSIMSHPMTNRKWVTLLYFFMIQSHQSCLIPWPIVCEFEHSLPGSLINHVPSHDQQNVSDTAALLLCQAVSSIMSHPMTNRMWVPTSFPGSLINHVSSDQQFVSDTTLLLLCQAVSSISSYYQQGVSDITSLLFQAVSSITLSHPMTNSMWVALRLLGISSPSSLIMSHPMTNRVWVTLLYFFARQSH